MGTIQKPPSPAEARTHLIELLREFDTAMIATTANDGVLHARPMAIARIDDSGAMYFATGMHTSKVDEIQRDHDVMVTVQGKRRFASLTGRCHLNRDRALIHELWSETWRAWFQDKDDPDIVILEVTPAAGEYWDIAGVRGVAFLFQAAKAAITGEKAPDASPESNAKVDLRGRP